MNAKKITILVKTIIKINQRERKIAKLTIRHTHSQFYTFNSNDWLHCFNVAAFVHYDFKQCFMQIMKNAASGMENLKCIRIHQ